MFIKQLSVLCLILLTTSTASAQFGGGFGGGGGEILGFGLSNTVESNKILITISKSGKTVTAFSAHTGKIAELSFDKKVEPFVPLVSNSVVCFANEKTAYAFSAMTGKWDQVNADHESITPVVGQNVICFNNGNKLYAFGNKHGKWISVETSKPSPPAIGSGFVKATDGSKIYICSENSTVWQVIDLEKDAK